MPSTRALLVPVLTTILLAAASPAGAQDWKRYSYPQDGFEVEFSGEVQAVPTQVSDETAKKIVRSTDYQEATSDHEYVVGASLLLVDVNFENGAKQSFAALGCKSTLSETSVPFPPGRAKEIRGADCVDGNWNAETRYYTKGKWFYQIIAVYRREGGSAEAARRFLQSFRLIDR